MKAYKGFDKDLKCRGFQYEIGKEYEEPEAIVCNRGFHACEEPIDVLKYYEPGKGSRYCEVEQDGQLSRSDEDSKIVSTKLKVVGEIGIPGIVKAQIEYVKSRCTNEHNAEPGKAATAGDSGAATAGYRGAATAGDSGAATAGNRAIGELPRLAIVELPRLAIGELPRLAIGELPRLATMELPRLARVELPRLAIGELP